MAKWSHVCMLREYSLAPSAPGVYEIGFWVEPSYFVPRYIGRARGPLNGDILRGTTIRSRLSAHSRERGSKSVAAAINGLYGTSDDDPDFFEQPTPMGRQKMIVEENLYCRWMVTTAAEAREANILQRHGISEISQYCWNRRVEKRKTA